MTSRVAEAVLQLGGPSSTASHSQPDDDSRLFSSYALVSQSRQHSLALCATTTNSCPLESFLGEIPPPGAPDTDTAAARIQLLGSRDTTLSSFLWRQALERARVHVASRNLKGVDGAGDSAMGATARGAVSSSGRAARTVGIPAGLNPEAEWEAVWNWLVPAAPWDIVASLVQILVDSALSVKHHATALPPYFVLLAARQLRWLRTRIDLWSSESHKGCSDELTTVVEDAYLLLMDHAACGFSEDLECFCLAFRTSSQRGPVLSKLKSITQQLRETVGSCCSGAAAVWNEDATTVTTMLQFITDAALLPLTKVALEACSEGVSHTPAARNLAQLVLEVEAVVGSAAAAEMPNLQTIKHCLQD